MMCFKYALSLAAVLTITLCCASAQAQSGSVGANFLRIGSGESMTVPFSSIAGIPTVGTYGGLTEIVVSGTGNALGPTVSDAFYFMDGSAVGIYYGLNMAYTGVPFAGGQNANIQRNMYFIDGIGDVSQNAIPGYSTSNTYRFVLDLPSDAGTLRFGVSDGVYSDNGGSYNISVFPVMRSAVVPEASALWLVMVGIPLVGAVVARRRKSPRS